MQIAGCAHVAKPVDDQIQSVPAPDKPCETDNKPARKTEFTFDRVRIASICETCRVDGIRDDNNLRRRNARLSKLVGQDSRYGQNEIGVAPDPSFESRGERPKTKSAISRPFPCQRCVDLEQQSRPRELFEPSTGEQIEVVAFI